MLQLSAAIEHARAELAASEKARHAVHLRCDAARRRLDMLLGTLAEAVQRKAAIDSTRCVNSRSVAAARDLILAARSTATDSRDIKDSSSAVSRFRSMSDQVRGTLGGEDGGRTLGSRLTDEIALHLARTHAAHQAAANRHLVPVSVQIRELFRQNPDAFIAATDVHQLLGIPLEKEPVVRQNLRRLAEAKFIVREDRGLYRMNPVPHPPPADEE